VTNEGVVTITFSEMMVIPPNLTAFQDDEVLIVTIEAGNVYKEEFLGFTWNVTKFQPLEFVI